MGHWVKTFAAKPNDPVTHTYKLNIIKDFLKIKSIARCSGTHHYSSTQQAEASESEFEAHLVT